MHVTLLISPLINAFLIYINILPKNIPGLLRNIDAADASVFGSTVKDLLDLNSVLWLIGQLTGGKNSLVTFITSKTNLVMFHYQLTLSLLQVYSQEIFFPSWNAYSD